MVVYTEIRNFHRKNWPNSKRILISTRKSYSSGIKVVYRCLVRSTIAYHNSRISEGLPDRQTHRDWFSEYISPVFSKWGLEGIRDKSFPSLR